MKKAAFVTAGLVSYSVTAGGETITALNDTYRLLSLTIEKGINSISSARLELIDGDPALAKFPVTDSKTFKPDAVVKIALGYDNVTTEIFTGVVTGVALASQGAQGVKVSVTCKNIAVAMTLSRRTRTFELKNVADTISQILGEYKGLPLSSSISDTSEPQQAVQQNLTDWDYIVTRAEANGMVVFSDTDTITTFEPTTKKAPVLALEYGTNLYSFALQLDARTQVETVTAQSWDPDTEKKIVVTAALPTLSPPGNLPVSTVSNSLKQGSYEIFATAEADAATLQKMVDGVLMRRVLALIQGTVEIAGTEVLPGSMVSLARIGDRFSGNYFVSKVSHSLSGGDWKTTLTLGMEEKPFAETKPNVGASSEAAKVLTGGDGLCKGVVKAIQPDADGRYRVQVSVADLNDAELWARLAQPYATADAGLYFFPEVGDQVIVGFLGGAGSSPIVLGSLYTKKRKPAYTPDEKNTKKAIVTSSKLTLEFDDDQKVVTLKTPAGNKVVVSDADSGKGIALTDQQGNTIVLSDKGIAITSKSTLSLKADQDITIESTGGKINLKATQDATIKGLNVSATADASLTLKGTASAELSASGNTTVKGVMVMIN